MKCSCWVKIECLAPNASDASSLGFKLNKMGLQYSFNYETSVVFFSLECKKFSEITGLINESCGETLYSIELKCWGKIRGVLNTMYINDDESFALIVRHMKKGFRVLVIDLGGIHPSTIKRIKTYGFDESLVGKQSFLFKDPKRVSNGLLFLEEKLGEILGY